MEKIDYLCFQARSGAADLRSSLADSAAGRILAAGARGLTLYLGDTDAVVPAAPLLMGRGAELGAVVSVWLDCLDDRGPVGSALDELFAEVDAYLVTESEPQPRAGRDWPDGAQSPGLTHFTWFPQPERLSDEDFFHGWHDIHTPHSADLHPLRTRYLRDAVARVLTPGSPPVRAIVFEHFTAVEDYADTDRLYGSPEALKLTMDELPLYADIEDISSRPLHEIIVTSP